MTCGAPMHPEHPDSLTCVRETGHPHGHTYVAGDCPDRGVVYEATLDAA